MGWSVLCGGVVVSLNAGRGRSRRLSTASIHDPPHHMEGPVDRVPLMWSGVCCVCVLAV